VERGILHLAVRLEPVNALAFLAPEAVGVGNRARVHLAIFGRIGIGAPAPFRRDVVSLLGNLLCLGLVHGPPPRRREPSAARPLFSSSLLCAAVGRRQGAARHTFVAGAAGQRTPNAPMIAPMTTSTASQWPASTTISM